MENENISKYRNEVIEKFINIEWIINGIISQHYFKTTSHLFIFEVLYDEYFSFGLKRRILEKIIPPTDDEMIQNLNRLNRIRNYFAHIHPNLFKGSMPPESNDEPVALDPRNLDRELDFKKLYEEFIDKEEDIAKYLFNIFEEFGGKTESPTTIFKNL